MNVIWNNGNDGQPVVNNTVISGTGGNDLIHNDGSNVTIKGLAGDDELSNCEGDFVIIEGGSGNDSIQTNDRGLSTVYGGSGDDTVTGGSGFIFGGNGNDSIGSGGYKGSAYGDAGDDDLFDCGNASESYFDGGPGNDRIGLGGNVGNTLNGGSGDDYLGATGTNLVLNGGAGNDTLDSHGVDYGHDNLLIDTSGNNYFPVNTDYTTVIAGNGNDSVEMWSSYLFVSLGGGKNTVSHYGANAWQDGKEAHDITVIGGKGADNITFWGGSNSYIEGGAGNDTLLAGTNDITVDGGKGNDFIGLAVEFANSVVQYANGDGNDTIEGFTSNDTLSITKGNISDSVISGENLILKIGNGKITIKDVKGSSFQLKLPNGNVSTFSVTKGGGTSDAETVKGDVSVEGVTVNGGSVNVDSGFDGCAIDLENYPLANDVNASNFKEILEVVGDDKNNFLSTGKGDDIISGGAGKDTLTGGDGNDVFIHTEGTDIITDYVENKDTIQLGKDVEFTGARLSGNDVILSTSTGSITLKKGKNKNISVLDEEGNEKIYKPVNLSLGLSYNGASQSAMTANNSYKSNQFSVTANNSYKTTQTTLTVSKSFTGKTIDLDNYASTVKVVNAASFTKNISVVGNRLNNSLVGGTGNDTLAGGKGKDTLTGGKGKDIFLHSKGNDVITDYTVGTDSIRLGEKIKITGSKVNGNDVILKTSEGSITVKKGKNKKITVIDSNGKKTSQIYNGIPTGLSYNSKKTALIANKNFVAENISLGDYVSTVKNVNAKNVKNSVEIVGNNLSNSLVGGASNDTLSGGNGKDTLTGGKGKDIFLHTKGNDVITDYTADTDSIQLGKGIKITGAKLNSKDVILKTSTGQITVKNGKNKKITVVDSEGNKTSKVYPAFKMAGLSYSKKQTVLTVGKSFSGETIELADYSAKVETVNAKNSSVKVDLIGNDSKNSLVGGAGNDTLAGGNGNDTLTGGKGKDVFVYTSGNDVITDYTVEADLIQLGDRVKIIDAKLSSKDVVLRTSEGLIKVKNGKNKKITVVDSEGNKTAKVYPVFKMAGLSYSKKQTVLTVGKSFSGETIDLADYSKTVKTVNAKNSSVKVDLVGNALNNSLVGGTGNDTLSGGKGKDTLTGGKGNDIFVYTSGNDVITDYTAGTDSIQLGEDVKIRNWKVNKTDVIFTTSTGKFTVKNGKGKKITVVNENGEKSTKKYSASSTSNVSSLWFAKENNFVSADNINSILTNNLTSADYKIESANFDGLNQKNSLVTFADKS